MDMDRIKFFVDKWYGSNLCSRRTLGETATRFITKTPTRCEFCGDVLSTRVKVIIAYNGHDNSSTVEDYCIICLQCETLFIGIVNREIDIRQVEDKYLNQIVEQSTKNIDAVLKELLKRVRHDN